MYKDKVLLVNQETLIGWQVPKVGGTTATEIVFNMEKLNNKIQCQIHFLGIMDLSNRVSISTLQFKVVLQNY